MPTLTYWVANCRNDHRCYNIRRKNKKEVLAEIAAHYKPSDYGEPKKVSIEYESAFDLAEMCLGEGSGFWE
jgi:hypothetical protein